MRVQRRQGCLDRTDGRRCEMRPAKHTHRRIARVDIKISIDLAKIIAALTIFVLMIFHSPR